MEAATMGKGAAKAGLSEADQKLADEAKAADAAANGNGEEPLDGEHDDEQEAPKPPALELEGEKTLNLTVGGPAPQVASGNLKTKMISIPGGQYEKHDEIDVVLRLRCSNVSFPDKRSGGSLFTERKHEFECIGIERIKP